MKSKLHSKFNLFSSAAFLVFCSTSSHAGTTSSTFSFQKDDVRKDGNIYVNGTFNGATYAVVDGRVTDNSSTSARSTTSTATLGNQNQSGSHNGQQHCGLFSYDLTELNNFITANTSPTSSVTVTSVSFKLITSGVGSGTAMTLNLFGTDPFTSAGCTWSNYTTGTPWTAPYQKDRTETTYNFTGGPSALTTSLGGTSPTTGTSTTPAGTALTWTSSANFISTLTSALARADKTLYLTARGSFFNTGDNRVNVNTSPATAVDDRPELLITVVVNSFSDWTGASSPSWATAGNWTTPPTTGDPVRFNSSSTSNLATVLDQNFDLSGVTIIDPVGAVSIGGANTLSLGNAGIDLSAATQNLTITSPMVLSAAQSWNVASGRTLTVGGAVTGSGALTVVGAGKAILGASVLPSGAGTGNLIVSGNLDLNGFSQSINGLSGAGVIDNSAADACTLTLGNNNAFSNSTNIIQDTGGDLSVVKVGSGKINLLGSNSFAGGFTNNGTGVIEPGNSNAFGTGPVVINNAITVYPADGSYTFANALTLNGATLRQGGGNNRLLTWSGPVSVTSNSTILSDGSTAGITIGGAVTLSGAATLTSTASGTAHTISGGISGNGSLTLSSGTLILSEASTYSGSTVMSAGTLRLNPNGTIPSSSNLTINGAGNLNVRNTSGWVYNGTISGDGTGQITLNSGTTATLAGNISGVLNVSANSTGTAATISGVISGAANVNVQATGATLTLTGGNDYTGTTSISGGTLIVGASNSLPNSTSATIGNGSLRLSAGVSDTVGTLAVTNASSTINLGANAAVAFANSSALEATWTGTLNLTGAFVSGQSIRFGTTSGGLTPAQLAKIAANGFQNFALDASGFLTASPAAAGYDSWKAQITNGQDGRTQDADGDGFTNIQEFLFGTSPIASNGSLVSTTSSGGNLILRWLQRESGATYQIKQSGTLAAGSWTAVASPVPAQDANQTGAPADYDYYTVTLPTSGGKLFFRVEGVEN